MADKLTKIALADIEPADDNLRNELTGIQDLADSIAFIGLLEPLRVVRNCTPGKYKLIAGHRRLAALELNRETETQAIVQSGTMEDSDRTAAMLIENMQRVDLHIKEQAEGVRRLIIEHAMTQADVAANLGVSKDWVKARVGISMLPDTVFEVAQYDRPLSVEHLAMLAELDDTRRERLLKNHPTPRPFHIEDAMSKQRSIALRDKQMKKLIKDKHLALTEADLKKIMKTELAELSGTDQEIKLRIGAATEIIGQWQQPEADTWAIVLKNIYDIDKHELNPKDIYVLTKGGGSQGWAKVELKQGAGVNTEPAELDEYDLIEQRNTQRREEYRADCKRAEVEYVEQAKPAALVAELLAWILDDKLSGWQTHKRVIDVLDRLGLDYADVDETVEDSIRKENIAANTEALNTYAAKNSANLARAAATAVIANARRWSTVPYPAEPEYEQHPDEEEYDDSGDPL